jgi:hypothetical protein
MLFIKHGTERQDEVFELILAALRGFCLLIWENHTVGLSAKKAASNTPPCPVLLDLSGIYEKFRLKEAQ